MSYADDQAAIIQLEARYASTWDRGDAVGWAGVFTPDGRFEIAPVGDRPPISLQGSDALAAFCTEFTTSYTGIHLPSLPDLEIDGDRARGRLHFHFVAIGRLAELHTVSRAATGHYDVQYVRTADGWRMEHRLETALASSRSEHFGVSG